MHINKMINSYLSRNKLKFLFFIFLIATSYMLLYTYKGPIIHDDGAWINILENAIETNDFKPYRGLWLLHTIQLLGFLLSEQTLQGIYFIKSIMFGLFAVVLYCFFSLFIKKKFLRIIATIFLLLDSDTLYAYFIVSSTTDTYLLFEISAFAILIIYLRKTINITLNKDHLINNMKFFLPYQLLIILFCLFSAGLKETGALSFFIVSFSLIFYSFFLFRFDIKNISNYLAHNSLFFILSFIGYILSSNIYKYFGSQNTPSNLFKNMNFDLITIFSKRAFNINQTIFNMLLALLIFFVFLIIYQKLRCKNKNHDKMYILNYLKINHGEIIPILFVSGVIVIFSSPLFINNDPRYSIAHTFLLTTFLFTFIDIIINLIDKRLSPTFSKLTNLLVIFLFMGLLIPVFVKENEFIFILKHEYVSFNDVESYIETVDSNAVVIFQSATHDLGNGVLGKVKNEYSSLGWNDTYIKEYLDQEYSNRTKYIVEYPLPWSTTFYKISNKQLIKKIQYWPVEVNIYVYNASYAKIKDIQYKDYPRQGLYMFYYEYAEDGRKAFKINENIQLILGESSLVVEKKEKTFSFFSILKIFNGLKIGEREFEFKGV